MASKIRSITVNFNAGTAKFNGDVERASAKIREFGGHTVSNMQASGAAIRTFEGNIQNNVRAVERFLTSVLPLGPVLRAAFPLVGAVAFAGLITETSKKVNEFFKDIRDAPERIRGAFSSANTGLRLTNDELKVANDRLENDIAKLEGKRQNTLKLALDEARVAADHLAKSLDKDLESLHKLISEESKTWIQKHITDGDSDLAKRLGGETGEGGFRGTIREISSRGNANIAGAGTDEAKRTAAQDALNQELLRAYDWEIKSLQQAMDRARGVNLPAPMTATRGHLQAYQPDIDPKEIELYKGVLENLKYERAGIPLAAQNQDLTARKTKDETNKENAQQDRPFEDRMKKFRAEIDAVQAKLNAIGKTQAAQNIAKAFGESQKAIEEVNKALERHNVQLTAGQKAQIRAAESTLVNTEAEAEWQTKLAAANTSIADRIRSQEMLTEAIGKGYEATKAANVETKLMQELGQHYGDAAWMTDHGSQVAGLRAGYGAEFDAQHSEQVGQSLQKLAEQTELEQKLAAVQSQGAEAVRQVTLTQKLLIIARDNSADSAKKLMAAEMGLYNAERANVNAADVTKTIEKAQATERLAKATTQGAAAVRAAQLANQLQQIQRDGPSSTRGSAAIMESRAAYSLELAQTAARADRLQSINDEIQKLQDAKSALGDTLALDLALRDAENQRLSILAQESLGLRGAQDGVRAFFLEMEKDAESAAEILYKSLNSALDRVSGQFAKMLTQKAPKGGWGQEWSKQFKDLGTSMVGSSLKSLMQTGLGAVGKAFGISGKPDGSPGNPLWVRMSGIPGLSGTSGTASAAAAGGGWMSKIAGALGFGGKSGDGNANYGGTVDNASPMDWGGFMADGGPVSASSAYIVGENGPEVLTGASGRITSHTELSRTFGGGGPTTIQYGPIDARGADLGAHNRIMRGLEMSSRAAAAAGVQGAAERAKRVPVRSGR